MLYKHGTYRLLNVVSTRYVSVTESCSSTVHISYWMLYQHCTCRLL